MRITSRRLLSIVLAPLALLAIPTACDTLRNPLEVESASRIPAGPLEIASNAKLLSDGAIADFDCAFNAYVTQGGTVGEEFIYAQQTASRTPYDRRNTTQNDGDYAVNSCVGLGVYTPLHVARQVHESLVSRLNGWTDAEVSAGAGSPNRTNLIATSSAYAGYALTLLGEGFCTMAVSNLNLDKSITYGGEIQRDSVFRLAVARFTEAITAATAAGNADILNMARVGRARVLMFLGDYPGARADAVLVPAGYVHNVTASDASPRRQNRVTSNNSVTNTALSVGEPYRSMGDLRVPVTATTSVSATGIVHYYQRKYAATSSSIPLATYEEAQLIIAEADIRAGDLPAALPIIAASRVRGGQVPFVGVTGPEYLAELVDQRRRELFAESHHLGDIIRFGIALQPATGTPYHFGGTYGAQVCLPLPAAERLNNPLIGG
ncbi:MAG: RagB/SusD family nutrient uptake outer membrane protein [Gemmatimonadaceae bacterium]